jgi:hypothetical protein
MSIAAPCAPLIRAALLGLLSLLLTSCRTLAPSAPELPGSIRPAAEVEPSVVNMPVRVDFRSTVDDLNARAPAHVGNINSDWIEDPPGNRNKYKYEIWRRPFALSVTDGAVSVATVVEYAAAGGYDPPIAPIVTGSCGVGESLTEKSQRRSGRRSA